MKQASDKTLLARTKRDLKNLINEHRVLRQELTAYRDRATKAEQELAEWKARFDQLLKLNVERGDSKVIDAGVR